jgi:hypothetical protein
MFQLFPTAKKVTVVTGIKNRDFRKIEFFPRCSKKRSKCVSLLWIWKAFITKKEEENNESSFIDN